MPNIVNQTKKFLFKAKGQQSGGSFFIELKIELTDADHEFVFPLSQAWCLTPNIIIPAWSR